MTKQQKIEDLRKEVDRVVAEIHSLEAMDDKDLGIMGDITNNFSRHEFKCPCCGAEGVSQILVQTLQDARDDYGQPINVSSGFRCQRHNAMVGGSENSSHLTGMGADILCKDPGDRFELLTVVLRYFDRVGVYARHLHVDVDSDKPQNVIWVGVE